MYSKEWYEKNKEKVAAQQKEYYQNNKDKAKLWKHNNNGLEYNGKNGAIFDFHHINPEEKDFNITSYLRHYNKIPERIYREVEKCILLCSNCHRLEHSDEYQANLLVLMRECQELKRDLNI